MARHLRTLCLALTIAVIAGGALAELPPLLNFTMTLEGDDEADIVHRAEILALQSAVGRLYFENRVIVAQRLLANFLDENRERFISDVTVLGRHLSENRYELEMSVGVFGQDLQSALEEYRFLFEPRPIPLTFVFLAETLDAARQEVPMAKPLVIAALDDAGLRVSEIAILSPDSRIDVAEGGTDPAQIRTLDEALTNAERGGVEILLTGQCTTTLSDNTELYYDEYYFYETTLLLRMFRVDTRELISEVVVSDSGAHTDDATAREIAIRKCVNTAVGQLVEAHAQIWPGAILNQTDYQLMITGIDPTVREILVGKLADMPGGAEVLLRSHYADVACINLVHSSPFTRTSIQERQALIEFLEAMDTPQLRIESVEGTRIVARVVD